MLFQYNPADINWFQSHTGNYVKSIVTSTRAYTHTHTHTHTNYKNRLVFFTLAQTNTHTSIIFIQPKSSILVKADFINKVYNFFIKIFLFQF